MPNEHSIYWTVPLYGNSTPNYVLKYHLFEKNWVKSDIVTYWVSNWLTDTSVSWTDLLNYGYTTWEDIQDSKWTDFVSQIPSVMFSSTDGKTYQHSGTNDIGENYEGVRTENECHPKQQSNQRGSP